MLETNKFFKFGEDLSYFVILRYKLRDFINRLCKWPNKRRFSEDFVTISCWQKKSRGI